MLRSTGPFSLGRSRNVATTILFPRPSCHSSTLYWLSYVSKCSLKCAPRAKNIFFIRISLKHLSNDFLKKLKKIIIYSRENLLALGSGKRRTIWFSFFFIYSKMYRSRQLFSYLKLDVVFFCNLDLECKLSGCFAGIDVLEGFHARWRLEQRTVLCDPKSFVQLLWRVIHTHTIIHSHTGSQSSTSKTFRFVGVEWALNFFFLI